MFTFKYAVSKSFLLFLTLFSLSTSNTCDFELMISQELLNEGFHRNMTYEIIVFGGRMEESLHSCIIGLEQYIPSGVYVNTDEFDDLKRTSQVQAFLNNKVNIELPAEQARPITAYVLAKIKENKATLWIPMHARYHYAVSGGGKARNEIPPPKVYVRCLDNRLYEMCEVTRPPDESLFCSTGAAGKCAWLQTPYVVLSKGVIWEVPVGNMDHYYITAVGTVTVVTVGSLYILKIILDYKMKNLKKMH